jgi:hypothetical protein
VSITTWIDERIEKAVDRLYTRIKADLITSIVEPLSPERLIPALVAELRKHIPFFLPQPVLPQDPASKKRLVDAAQRGPEHFHAEMARQLSPAEAFERGDYNPAEGTWGEQGAPVHCSCPGPVAENPDPKGPYCGIHNPDGMIN